MRFERWSELCPARQREGEQGERKTHLESVERYNSNSAKPANVVLELTELTKNLREVVVVLTMLKVVAEPSAFKGPTSTDEPSAKMSEAERIWD